MDLCLTGIIMRQSCEQWLYFKMADLYVSFHFNDPWDPLFLGSEMQKLHQKNACVAPSMFPVMLQQQRSSLVYVQQGGEDELSGG